MTAPLTPEQIATLNKSLGKAEGNVEDVTPKYAVDFEPETDPEIVWQAGNDAVQSAQSVVVTPPTQTIDSMIGVQQFMEQQINDMTETMGVPDILAKGQVPPAIETNGTKLLVDIKLPSGKIFQSNDFLTAEMLDEVLGVLKQHVQKAEQLESALVAVKQLPQQPATVGGTSSQSATKGPRTILPTEAFKLAQHIISLGQADRWGTIEHTSLIVQIVLEWWKKNNGVAIKDAAIALCESLNHDGIAGNSSQFRQTLIKHGYLMNGSNNSQSATEVVSKQPPPSSTKKADVIASAYGGREFITYD